MCSRGDGGASRSTTCRGEREPTRSRRKGDNVRPEHLKEFAERWPTWLNFNGDITRTAMPNGFYGIGGGWRRVLWNLCVELEPHVEALNRKLATQDPARSFEVLPGNSIDHAIRYE